MQIPLSWLKEHFSLHLDPDKISSLLTLAGLEVDRIEEISPPFSGVVACEIQTIEPHPQADQLRVLHVFDGTATSQVVCGDLTCKLGMKTAFARIGAQLPDGKGGLWTVKKRELRKVDSFGMLCSEQDLALSSEGLGLMPLDLPLGTDLKEWMQDTVFEISLTPNLGHCMSILGVARELAAALNTNTALPSFELIESKETINSHLKLKVTGSECAHYMCRMIKGVTVGPSPYWIVDRLKKCGIRSVNNIVDVTNYVMLQYGQPLHAFDYAKVKGGHLAIKTAPHDIPLTSLDDQTRIVPKGALCIWDKEEPLAIAGIMGGKSSAIENSTVDVILESARFAPSSVRKTSKKLGLRSESSSRFEKGVDPQGLLRALNHAAFLIAKVGNGNIVSGILEEEKEGFVPKKIRCRLPRINQLLGTSLSLSEVESFLKRLEMEVHTHDHTHFTITAPSYRNDIHEEIDLIEEVARIYGYNHIAKSKPKFSQSSIPSAPIYLLEQQIRQKCIGFGLQEFLTCDLLSPKLASIELSMKESALIHVLHPSSIDQSILRTSLLPGLLQSLKHNENHQTRDIAAFEVGKTHFRHQNTFQERSTAGLILTGHAAPPHFSHPSKEWDILDLKGIVENLLISLNLELSQLTTSHFPSFHPTNQALIHVQGVVIGVIGEVHPDKLALCDLERSVFFAQIDLQDLLGLMAPHQQMIPLPALPGSERDWTVTLPENLPIGKIFEEISHVRSSLLKKVDLLDLYRSDTLGSDKKNATFRFLYRDDIQTVSSERVDKEHQNLIQTVQKKLPSPLF